MEVTCTLLSGRDTGRRETGGRIRTIQAGEEARGARGVVHPVPELFVNGRTVHRDRRRGRSERLCASEIQGGADRATVRDILIAADDRAIGVSTAGNAGEVVVAISDEVLVS